MTSLARHLACFVARYSSFSPISVNNHLVTVSSDSSSSMPRCSAGGEEYVHDA